MKKIILSFTFVIMAFPLLVAAQWPSNVTPLDGNGSDSATVSGNLANGAIMQDLSWAANSSNACFVSLQNWKFSGNHVLYATTIPPRSIMTITVSPADTNVNLSLYGYMIGAKEFKVVPNLLYCINCEADFKWDRPVKNKVQTSERKILFQNPTQNTSNIVIGVAAPKDVSTGEFNLKIKLKL